MKKSLSQSVKLVVLGAAVLAGVSGARGQSFSMQIVADNDFAVFGGTATSINDLIYQNDFSWPDQLSNLSSFSFDLAAGDTTFYLLGLGGGGTENISGTVNDVDISSLYTYDPDTDSFVWSVSESSDLAPYLTGYLVNGVADSSVADGTYDASLADVQIALPNLTWGDPTPTTGVDGVASQSPTGHGFHFDDSTAHLFRINASDLGVAITPAPEPSTWALALVGGVLLGRNFIFRRSHLYALRTLAAASCMMLDRKLIHRRQQHRSTI